MPFASDTLPPEVERLPTTAQSIWLSVFNSAFRTFAGSEADKEEASFIAAWGAVRSKFAQDEAGEWSMKSAISFDDPRGFSGRWTRSVKFTPDLLEAKKRITYGEVYVPWEVDAQGDFADEDTIEEAAHAFIKHFGTIGEQHKYFGGKGVPVETFIARDGDRDFKIPGTWALGTQWSEEMWQKVLNGEVTGYSLGGDWTRIPIVAGAEFAEGKSINVTSAGMHFSGSKSEGPLIAELDEALFENTVNAGPRVISQIVGLNVDEVSGVSLPANRKPFKLFKSQGGIMRPSTRKVFVLSKGTKCSCEDEDNGKAVPTGSPWVKLYENLIEAGMDPAQARKLTEEALGPPPAEWTPEGKEAGDEEVKAGETLTIDAVASKADELVGAGNGLPVASLLQAKYAAGDAGGIALPEGMTIEDAIAWAVETGTAAGILALKSQPAQESVTLLKQVKSGIKSILRHLGVKEAEPTKEDDAMTPQEKQEFDELKALVKSLVDAKAVPVTAPEPAKIEEAKEATPAGVAGTTEGGDGEYVPTAGELELHGRVKELEATITELRARPGVSEVGTIAMAPEAVESGKSVGGGYRYSNILSTHVPTSASSADIKANAERTKRLQERRNSYGSQGQRRVR